MTNNSNDAEITVATETEAVTAAPYLDEANRLQRKSGDDFVAIITAHIIDPQNSTCSVTFSESPYDMLNAARILRAVAETLEAEHAKRAAATATTEAPPPSTSH